MENGPNRPVGTVARGSNNEPPSTLSNSSCRWRNLSHLVHPFLELRMDLGLGFIASVNPTQRRSSPPIETFHHEVGVVLMGKSAVDLRGPERKCSQRWKRIADASERCTLSPYLTQSRRESMRTALLRGRARWRSAMATRVPNRRIHVAMIGWESVGFTGNDSLASTLVVRRREGIVGRCEKIGAAKRRCARSKLDLSNRFALPRLL